MQRAESRPLKWDEARLDFAVAHDLEAKVMGRGRKRKGERADRQWVGKGFPGEQRPWRHKVNPKPQKVQVEEDVRKKRYSKVLLPKTRVAVGEEMRCNHNSGCSLQQGMSRAGSTREPL